MDSEKLKRANELSKEINVIHDFLDEISKIKARESLSKDGNTDFLIDLVLDGVSIVRLKEDKQLKLSIVGTVENCFNAKLKEYETEFEKL